VYTHSCFLELGEPLCDATGYLLEILRTMLFSNARPSQILTLWLPVYEYIVPGNQGKTKDISVDLPTA